MYSKRIKQEKEGLSVHFSRSVIHALLASALALSFLGILYYFLADNSQSEPMPIAAASVAAPVEENMLVYVAGAVEQPGVYNCRSEVG